MSSVNLDTLATSVIQFDHAFWSDKKVVGKKIQEVVNQLGVLNPTVKSELLQGYQDATQLAEHILYTLNFRQAFQCQEMLNSILSIIAKALPGINIQQKIEQQRKLTNAIQETLKTNSLDSLEKTLKEGVDLNATPANYATKSWIEVAIELECVNQETAFKAVKLFLQYGAKITPDNKERLIHFLFKPDIRSLVNDELLELLMDRGFDMNQDGLSANTLVGYTDSSSLVYYGSPVNKSLAQHPKVSEALYLRADVLEEMNGKLPPEQRKELSQLTNDERKALAKRCREQFRFNEAWGIYLVFPGLAKSESPEMEKSFKLHDAFLKAIYDRDFDQASKLLKEGKIELHAPLIRNSDLKLVSLLSHASTQGDVKLVEWLLKAGANPNVATNAIPPILATALNPCPDQSEILALLLKAGADVNLKDPHGYPWILSGSFEGHLATSAQDSTDFTFMGLIKILIKSGLDTNITCSKPTNINYTLWNVLMHSGESRRELWKDLAKALIYHGCGNEKFLTSEQHKEIALRNEILADLMKKSLLEEEALKTMSSDIIGLITSYHPHPLDSLTPAQRIELAECCSARSVVSRSG